MFRGCDANDEDGMVAMFMELPSCPATVDAGKACDAYGMLEGNILTQANAEDANTEAELKGTPTWVRLPKDQQPALWRNYKMPVRALMLALPWLQLSKASNCVPIELVTVLGGEHNLLVGKLRPE